MNSIFVFNPETDIVLGLDVDSYTPNKNILSFRKRLSLMPALYANRGDTIVISDHIKDTEISTLPYYDIAVAKQISILSLTDIKKRNSFQKSDSFLSLSPWGWNKEIYKIFSSLSLSVDIPVSLNDIVQIRKLSNRQLTISFFKDYESTFNLPSPRYLDNINKVIDFISSSESFCMKAPWSSSGRGIIFSDSVDKRKMIEWAGGKINSQGGIIIEPLYGRKIDFASEWHIDNGEICYCGLSLFNSDSRGKYCGNNLLEQSEIKRLISIESDWDDSILYCQREFIKNYISPFYNGPLGFDMLVTDKGKINPCVEINIRRTMGHVAIDVERQLSYSSSPVRRILEKYFPDRIFSVK